MPDAQIAAARGGSIFHIPTALGAIVATDNVPEVTSQLRFYLSSVSADWAAQVGGDTAVNWPVGLVRLGQSRCGG